MKKISSLIIFLFSFYIAFACECEIKPTLDIRDWNDNDVIFSGVLTKYTQNAKHKSLTFTIQKVYKGKVQKKSVQFLVSNIHDHEAFHHVKQIKEGAKWIIFASKHTNGGKELLTLTDETEDGFCMLTRPLATNDSYIESIKKIVNKPFLRDHVFLKKNTPFAKGSIQNSKPIGIWKYFNTKSNFWTGTYFKGRRNGKWLHKAVNYKKEQVIIGSKDFDNGILKERIEYNYIGNIIFKEIHKDTVKTRIFYNKQFISAKWIVNKLKNTTLIEKYKNGKLTDVIEENRVLF